MLAILLRYNHTRLSAKKNFSFEVKQVVNQITRVLESGMRHFSFSNKLCGLYYNRLIDKEITMLKVKANDRVLFIGGGAFPYSALYLYQKTKCRIDVIDCEQDVIAGARQFVQKHQANINVFHACGRLVELSAYDHVIVAKQVAPKSEVVNHIITNKPLHTNVIVRTAMQNSLPKPSQIQPLKYSMVKALWLYNH